MYTNMVLTTDEGTPYGWHVGDSDGDNDPNIRPTSNRSRQIVDWRFEGGYLISTSHLWRSWGEGRDHCLAIADRDQHMFAAWDGNWKEKYKWNCREINGRTAFMNQKFNYIVWRQKSPEEVAAEKEAANKRARDVEANLAAKKAHDDAIVARAKADADVVQARNEAIRTASRAADAAALKAANDASEAKRVADVAAAAVKKAADDAAIEAKRVADDAATAAKKAADDAATAAKKTADDAATAAKKAADDAATAAKKAADDAMAEAERVHTERIRILDEERKAIEALKDEAFAKAEESEKALSEFHDPKLYDEKIGENFEKLLTAYAEIPDPEKTEKRSCAVMGKTSAGKSTMINSMFNTNCKTSPIVCTKGCNIVHEEEGLEVWDVFGDNDHESYTNFEHLTRTKKMHAVVLVYTESVDHIIHTAKVMKALKANVMYFRNKSEDLLENREDYEVVMNHDTAKLKQVTNNHDVIVVIGSAKKVMGLDQVGAFMKAE